MRAYLYFLLALVWVVASAGSAQDNLVSLERLSDGDGAIAPTFFQCRVGNGNSNLHMINILVHIKTRTEEGATFTVDTFDQSGLLGGAPFSNFEMPKLNSGKSLVLFETQTHGKQDWILYLTHRDPREISSSGMEVMDGQLAVKGEENPRYAGMCVVARTEEAPALFERFKSDGNRP